MMLEALSFFARSKPDAVALIDRISGELTYAQTEQAVISLAVGLLTEVPDLQRLQPVGVACIDKRNHLLLTFALEALGVATLAFVQPSDPGLNTALGHCKLIIAEHLPHQYTGRFFQITQEWMQRTIAAPTIASFAPAVWGGEGVVTLLTTSGSTGTMKCIALHRTAYDAREANRVWQYGLTAQSRYLVAMPISVGIVGMVTRAVLRVGGTLVFWDNDNALMVSLGITHTTLLPSHVQSFLQAMPIEFVPRQNIKLFSTGAPLSAGLRDRAVARLGADVKNSYGTNETGTCAWFGIKGDGDVLPGVDVQILDRDLNVLPQGVPGIVSVRSPELALGYLDRKLSGQRFRDGWFVTDDIGVMHGPRQLSLVGRSDTMLNIGGNKLLPEDIEDLLSQRQIARDLAVCTLPNGNGVDELYIAIVEPRLDHQLMIETIGSCLGSNFGHIRIVLSDQVPRNAQGKILRQVLREKVALHVKQS